MTDLTSGNTVDTWTNGSKKVIWVETAATAVSDDTFTLILANYGVTTIEGITGYVHTATDSVVAEEAPTTSVTTGTLTVAVGGTAVTAKRVYKIEGDSV